MQETKEQKESIFYFKAPRHEGKVEKFPFTPVKSVSEKRKKYSQTPGEIN